MAVGSAALSESAEIAESGGDPEPADAWRAPQEQESVAAGTGGQGDGRDTQLDAEPGGAIEEAPVQGSQGSDCEVSGWSQTAAHICSLSTITVADLHGLVVVGEGCQCWTFFPAHAPPSCVLTDLGASPCLYAAYGP